MMEGGEEERVCCMCGDVGFSDKIFRCNKCHHRFQHSYCSNSYSSESSKPVEVCEWCLQTTTTKQHLQRVPSNLKKPTSISSSSKLDAGISIKYNNNNNNNNNNINRSDEKMKQHNHHGRDDNEQLAAVNNNNSEKLGKSPAAASGAPSPRTRRYKLLKDVMC